MFSTLVGFSRSGSTISGGLLARVSHTAAAEYTFILAVPMMVAASGLDLIKSWDILSAADIPLFATDLLRRSLLQCLQLFHS